jgi:hypothetical protein
MRFYCTPQPCEPYKSTKREPGAWVTLFLGDVTTDTSSSRFGVGRKADDLALLNKIVAKSKEVNNQE